MTMATLSKILEGASYNSMITPYSYVTRGRKTSIIAAKNKNIISHSKLQECGIRILYCYIFLSFPAQSTKKVYFHLWPVEG